MWRLTLKYATSPWSRRRTASASLPKCNRCGVVKHCSASASSRRTPSRTLAASSRSSDGNVCGSIARCGIARQYIGGLLLVPLDHRRRPHLGLVGVLAELALGAALAEQVPALVE